MKKRLRLIVTAFSISFAIMASLSFFSLKQFNILTSYSDQVDHTNQIITQLYKLETLLKELDIKERGFMITKDSTYIQELVAVSSTLYPAITRLEKLTAHNEEQTQKLIILKSAIALRLANFKDNLNYIDSTKSNAISPYYNEGRQVKLECIRHIEEMRNKENALLLEKFSSKRHYQQITSNTLRYLMVIFGLVTIILFIFMIREFKTRITYQDELHTKLVDLRRSHAELEQIAFAASHDLQEPLRKIRIFSNRLLMLKKDPVDTEARGIIDRITYAARRMQELIDDMVNLTSLIREEGEKSLVDLNHTVKIVLDELDEKVQEEHAVIHQEVLPEINGYPRQFQILFKSLLDNSLKFTREGVRPVIAIRADKTAGDELVHINKELGDKSFYRITISDNGIGFDNKFISKMFQLFQRLHTQESEYEGKGIGLAICQRIMVNHEGYILAHGHPEVGATFKLFFPIEP